MAESFPYAELAGTRLLVPTATRPILVRLELAYRYWPIPMPREEWDAAPEWTKGWVEIDATDKLRPHLLLDGRWTVGSVRAVDIVDRGRSFPELSLGFVVGSPKAPGVTADHITRAWDRGYRQFLVLPRAALPTGWPG